MADLLRFLGAPANGCNRFSKELRLPNSNELSVPIRDWPDVLESGSLNVHVERSGFPEVYLARFKQASFKCLDSRLFVPQAELPWTDIKGNTLPPSPGQPDRGRAQVWRASITNLDTKAEHLCWVVRRIGSGIFAELELVAATKLRTVMELTNSTPVAVTVEGKWK